MSEQIIEMQDWLQTPPGRYLLDWERAQFDRAVADIFGYHALQLGLPEVDALRSNRMPHRWLALPAGVAAPAGATSALQAEAIALPVLAADFEALPFPESSLDLVVLPHSLEMNRDPHATLREVERVLVPEGRVVICCLNPASLWGLRQRRAHLYRRMRFGSMFLPEAGEFIGYWRLRDWLRLLSFEVESGRFGCYRPALSSEKWLGRFEWMDRVGERWWPILGGAYFIVAVKRVRGMKLMGASWKSASALAPAPAAVATAPVSIANKQLPERCAGRNPCEQD